MNIKDETISSDANNISEQAIVALLPSKTAYMLGVFVLFISSLAGGLIGYASAKIFIPSPSLTTEMIFSIVSTVAISWSMSIVVSISLKASVEFKSRKKLFPSSKRPSKLLK